MTELEWAGIGLMVIAVMVGIHYIHWKRDPDGWNKMMIRAYPTKEELRQRRRDGF